MSDSQSSLSYELLVCSDPFFLPIPIHRGPDLVYQELNRLAELMPQRYADVFRFRWGLTTHFPHVTSQTARKFEIPQSTAEDMLARCLWNVARYAHTYELPAIRALVGEEPETWARRAWEHADRRWGSDEACESETVLLLAAAGMDVREANLRAKRHMVDIGIRRRGKKWGKPPTAEQQVVASGEAIDRILQQIIWPNNTTEFSDLEAFVNGHWFLPIRGHLFSPLVAMFSPRWWPRISPPTEVLL